MTWTIPPTKFTDKVRKDSEGGATRIALKLLRSLIFSSPVDTGRFRGNWVVGLKKRNTSYTSGPVSGVPNLSAGQSELKKHKNGDSIFISNNLPYAKRLNDGWSQQAPANFVQRAIARVTK